MIGIQVSSIRTKRESLNTPKLEAIGRTVAHIIFQINIFLVGSLFLLHPKALIII
jgi:hypothetical protein